MLLSFLLLLSTFASSLASIKSCNPNSIFQVSHVRLTPDPPILEKPFFIDIGFNNTGPEISDGLIENIYTINGITMPSKRIPLCEYFDCPVSSGNNYQVYNSTWSFISGTITIESQFNATDGQELLCLLAHFVVK